ncbi:MAG TPA: sulfatase-like hydrolase/transferase [Opitutaceae bacterium]|nr:sulfatase-like hydrolase/transferase [Opitutaceae bacterium]
MNAGCVAAGLFALALPFFAHARPPNIVLIVADDLGYSDVGFTGGKDIPTPRIDRLARDGVEFTAGYVTHPYCSPSRAGLLSGRAQARFGHECNPGNGPEEGLPVTETLLPAKLKPAGYVSALVGKWHLGAAEKFRPLQRGFDEFFGFLGGTFPYFVNARARGNADTDFILRGNERVDPKTIAYLTETLAAEGAAFIRRQRAQPFFLYLAFNAPHAPDQATPKYLERFPDLTGARRTYAAMVSALDDGVGVVLDELRRQNLDENTLVFFISDNGGRAEAATNRPFRGLKGSTFEGGVRVPFAARWTGHFAPGTICRTPVSSLDIHATALARAGIAPLTDDHVEGLDLVPIVAATEGTMASRTLFWRVWSGWDFALREGNYKLTKPGWSEEAMLFDLSADVSEHRDLSATLPDVKARLLEKWKQWNAANVPQRWDDEHKRNVAREKAAGWLD